MSDFVLTSKNLCKSYKKPVLKNLNVNLLAQLYIKIIYRCDYNRLILKNKGEDLNIKNKKKKH